MYSTGYRSARLSPVNSGLGRVGHGEQFASAPGTLDETQSADDAHGTIDVWLADLIKVRPAVSAPASNHVS